MKPDGVHLTATGVPGLLVKKDSVAKQVAKTILGGMGPQEMATLQYIQGAKNTKDLRDAGLYDFCILAQEIVKPSSADPTLAKVANNIKGLLPPGGIGFLRFLITDVGADNVNEVVEEILKLAPR